MRELLVNLLSKIYKMKSTTETNEAIAKIILDNEYTESKTTDIEIHVDGKNCCMRSVCSSNYRSCDKAIVDVNTSITLPETDPEKCCIFI
jgi:hypothetical protein